MSSAAGKPVCRGLVLTGGCLLEQIHRCCIINGDMVFEEEEEEEWGTLTERAILM